jgi:hypothetical protein
LNRQDAKVAKEEERGGRRREEGGEGSSRIGNEASGDTLQDLRHRAILVFMIHLGNAVQDARRRL